MADNRIGETTPHENDYVRPPAAARILKLSTSTLAKRRMRGEGPPYVKQGALVTYKVRDLLDDMESRKRTSTSEVAR